MDRRLLHALFGPGSALAIEAELSDADLLARLAAGGDGRAAAFAEAVRRHGPMVWAVCRGTTCGAADAEDAFQATFLALVKSPQSAVRSGTLPGWLHGVATRVAAGLKRTAARRKRREARAAVPEGHSPVPDSAWGDVYAAVQAEVARLPAGLKAAFVLCEIGRVPHAEAAQQLGWKPGTLTGTLARAKRRLIARLAERGIAPAALAGVGAASGSAAAVPWKLIEAVNVFPSAAAGTVPVALVQLATEGLTMGVSHMKLLAAAAVIAGGLTVGVGPALLPSADAQAPGGGFGRGSSEAKPPDAKPAPSVPPVTRAVARMGPEWHYEVASVPATAAAFLKIVEDFGRRGWEYVGLTVCSEGVKGVDDPKLLFKKPVRVFDVSELVVPPTAAPAGAADAQLQRLRADLTTLKADLARLGRNPNLPAEMQSYLLNLNQFVDNLVAGATPPEPRVTLPGVPSTPAPPAGPPGAPRIADAGSYNAGVTAQLKSDLDHTREQLTRLEMQYQVNARKLASQGAAPAPATPAPRPAADPKPAVFALQGGPEVASMFVPVVEAGLDRESAKLGGPVRVAAFGNQLLVFGGTPQTAERVTQLMAALNVKLVTTKPPTPSIK